MKYNWYALQLAVICVVVWIFQLMIPSITDEFSLVSSEIFSKPWTIVTYIFLHGSFDHLFYNMFALVLFGSILERVIGGKKFLITFFIGGIAAGIGSVLFYTSSIGASGAIFGIIGVLGLLRPSMAVWTFGFPLPMIAAVILWAAGDLIGLFNPSDLVGHAAHLFGLAFGLIYGIYLRKDYGEHPHPKKKSGISEEEFEKWEDRYVKII